MKNLFNQNSESHGKLEQVLAGFESDFRSNQLQPLTSYVTGLKGETRLEVLTELLATDLELNIRRGRKKRTEDYFAEFPEIARDQAALLEVVKSELQTRIQFENSVPAQEILERFPQVHVELQSWLNANRQEREVSAEKQRFRKKRLHRQGGLGNVWLGRDDELLRKVAIKEVKGKFSSDVECLSRFSREALITGQLEHPGIVPIYGCGKLANGTPYYAMRFVEGETLQSRIAHALQTDRGESDGNRLAIHRLLMNFIEVCDVVAYAHSRGVVHRDLKPANIMVGFYGETLVVDWGLAKLLNSDHDPHFVEAILRDSEDLHSSIVDTPEDRVAGSPAYMSPEQTINNEQLVGIASDIYGLGATLLTVITGIDNPNQAVSSGSFSTRSPKSNLNSAIAVPRWLSPLVSVCRKAMAERPEERYTNAKELKHEIENFLAAEKVDAHADSWFDRWSRFHQRNPALAGTLATGLILLTLISILSAAWINSERNKAVQSQMAEQTARRRADEKTRQLKGTVEMVSNLLAGDAACGLKPDATLREGVEYLVDQAENDVLVEQMPVVQGNLFGLNAKYLKGRGQAAAAANWYRRAIDAMTHQGPETGLAEDDSLVLELYVGLSTALKQDKQYQAALDTSDQVLGLIRGKTDSDKRSRFAALTSKTAALAELGRMDEAFNCCRQAIRLGATCYPAEHHHLFRPRKMLAVLHSRQKNYEDALSELVTMREGYLASEKISTASKLALDFNIAQMKVRLKQFEAADKHLKQLRLAALETYAEEDPSFKALDKQIKSLLKYVAKAQQNRAANN